MADLDFLVHLPLVRIDQERLPFGPGQLYRMPFAHYDSLTLGAFSEQQKQFEATEPVFLAFTVPIADEGLEPRTDEVRGLSEVKMPSTRTPMLDDIGLGVVNWAFDSIVTHAWTSLLLAAPAGGFAPPRWSQTFVAIDDHIMYVGGHAARGARVQGEADHEYLFMADAPSERLSTAVVADAAKLMWSVRDWEKVPDLHAALTTLRATGLPMLSPQDRLTLSVQALEALLLPEVQTTLKRTFARRTSSLLGRDADGAARLWALASRLYSLRSESVHGNELPSDEDILEQSSAPVMLAAAIRAMGERVSKDEDIETIRGTLDAGYTSTPGTASVVSSEPVGRASDSRLARRRPSDVFVGFSSMAANDDRVCAWAPLLGLGTEGLDATGGMLLGDAPSPVFMPLSPRELLDLEERDIRRDFLMGFMQQGVAMSVLMTAPEHEPTTAQASTPYLDRQRDLGVITLRLAGYDHFHDPELFGSTVFEGKRRLRRATALRQTIAEEIRHEPAQRVGPGDHARLAPLWRLVNDYDQRGRTRQIEYVLSLYRRSFDREFLYPEQRAVLLIGLLESMLGRFRPPTDPIRLEDLVATIAGNGEDVAWFRAEGRTFRNRVAHGEFAAADGIEPLDRMSRIVSRAVRALLAAWNAADEESRRNRPSALLIARSALVRM